MARRKITAGTARRLAARYGVTSVGSHYVPCHWCTTPVLLLIRSSGSCLPRVVRWTAEIDHLFPVAAGGTNDLSNLVFACGPCNASRGHRHATPPRLRAS